MLVLVRNGRREKPYLSLELTLMTVGRRRVKWWRS